MVSSGSAPHPPLQAMLVGMVPGIGWLLSAIHMAILYSLYSFEYKWMYEGETQCTNTPCCSAYTALPPPLPQGG